MKTYNVSLDTMVAVEVPDDFSTDTDAGVEALKALVKPKFQDVLIDGNFDVLVRGVYK